MTPSLVASSDPAAQHAAQAALSDGGGCIDAVIAGFFGAAGADPAVLFSPAVVLVGGVGMGMRSVDGRMLQPGRGIPRPRGLLPTEPTPPGALVAVPRAVAMLALLPAYGANLPFAALARYGTREARRGRASARAELLATIERHGAMFLRAAEVRRALLAAGGSAAGGLLTETDLDEALPADAPAARASLGPAGAVAVPPWVPAEASGPPVPTVAEHRARVLVAADDRGLVAALSYVPDAEGIELPACEVSVARAATPVRRGVPRVTPGTPQPAPSPVAALARPEQGWFAAVAVASGRSLAAPDFAHDSATPPLRQTLERALARAGGSEALAASVQRRRTTLTRVP